MGKEKVEYVCQECGHRNLRWAGQCPACGMWNTLVEEVVERKVEGKGGKRARVEAVSLGEIPEDAGVRRATGMAEFDRIMGGGVVAGQVVLIGGDPGIGKSTILLQVAQRLASAEGRVLYVSGEESLGQTKLRAERLRVDNPHVLVAAATEIRSVLEHAARVRPGVLMIDSIQVMYDEEISSAPGSVTQVRECAALLARYAKEERTAVFIVGHVTKTGAIAGPRVVEHLVDTVLYFEGERHNVYRILRAVKNRFGSTDEIGVFEMTGHGLVEVPNPSALFLSQRQEQRSGSAVGAAVEGTQPLLLEVQGLVASTPFGMPVRKAVGMDVNRLAMLLAVIEKRVGIRLSSQDVFVNLAGGLKVSEPGLDLACAAAVASSFYDRAVAGDTVLVGEIGLGGEVRAVSQIERRVMEARRLGFKRCIVPAHNLKAFREKGKAEVMWQGVRLVGCEDVQRALQVAIGDLD
ncbi:MAG: DNA repair protein RadA [bacterium]|nr:DNA repair protein RadA [bacterium]